MLGDIRQLTLEQFASLLMRPWRRRITEVHIHHTWQPTHGQWRGEQTVRAMRRVHIETNGWSDIAQHLTIGPDGSLWTGRHLDKPPASSKGHNGNAVAGPLMIEMVGDFDVGRDPFSMLDENAGGHRPTGQAQAAYSAVAAICIANRLSTEQVLFHRDFTSAKSCPGTSIDQQRFRAAVVEAMASLPANARTRSLAVGSAASDESSRSARRYLLEFGESCVASPTPAELDGEPACTLGATRDLHVALELSRVFVQHSGFSDADQQTLRRHVVNLQMGRLSDSGEWATGEGDIDILLSQLDSWVDSRRKASQIPHVVFIAHGGLVEEGKALRGIVLRDTHWWLANGVYPVFFVWETGINEVFRDTERRRAETSARGISDLGDRLLELSLGPTLGRPTWRRIKSSAQLSSGTLDDGNPGGAAFFAERFAARFAAWAAGSTGAGAGIRLHAVGHSAGAIFHCHFVPCLIEQLRQTTAQSSGFSHSLLDTLSFLAPAARMDLFSRRLMSAIEDGTVGRFALFTMDRRSEEADSVGTVYRKSLLYFVRNACEEGEMPPILGLQESVRADPSLCALLEPVDGTPAKADVIWSPTKAAEGRNACKARTHGSFDEDASCMNAVMRRVLGIDDAQHLPSPHLGSPARRTEPQLSVEPLKTGVGEQAGARITDALATGRGERRLALCIGIDDYPEKPLDACVADSRAWGRWLSSEGFSVRYLHNAQATEQAIMASIDNLLDSAGTGDCVVIQFAGHGTQVIDYSGDEREDNLDEAWVPHDYIAGRLVLDDDIGALFDRYRDRGFELVLFTDCCHSGTSARAAFGPGALQLQAHSRFLEMNPNVRAQFARTRRARGVSGDGRDPLGWEIHFAACQDRQSAYESGGNGHFTTAALRSLSRTSVRRIATYGDLSDALAEAFQANPHQTPNFRAKKGVRQRELWAGTSSRVPVASDTEDSVHPKVIPQALASADDVDSSEQGAYSAGSLHVPHRPENGTSWELLDVRLERIERRLDAMYTSLSGCCRESSQ